MAPLPMLQLSHPSAPGVGAAPCVPRHRIPQPLVDPQSPLRTLRPLLPARPVNPLVVSAKAGAHNDRAAGSRRSDQGTGSLERLGEGRRGPGFLRVGRSALPAPAKVQQRGRLTACQVSAGKGGDGAPPPPGTNLTEKLASLGILAFWGAWLAYGATLAPNQTPTIDQYYLEKLIGLKGDDGFVLNSVVFSLWNLMGLFPLLYAMLLIPASRTDRTKVPVWPFSLVSVFLGAFALLPYFALWTSGEPLVPTEEERGKLTMRVWESKITAAAVLAGVVGLVANAVTAPALDWVEFGQIIQQSRLFHVTTSDFCVLALSAPFWTYNDMSYRNWEPRNSWGLALLLLPVLGPFLYLVLRPRLPPPS